MNVLVVIRRVKKMTKELEHLEIIEDWANEHHDSKEVWEHSIPVQEALQRLEAIDNSQPSEALLGLKHIKKYYVPEPCSSTTYDYLETIKQALIKSQENEKVLNKVLKLNSEWAEELDYKNDIIRIIYEKNVNIGLVKVLGSVEQYNQTYVYDNMLNVKWCLTQEEFELVKRYADGKSI